MAFVIGVKGQCNLSDKSNIKISGISVTAVTCPQNGSLAINGVTGGGGSYAYEIVAGPIVRGIQSQNIFPALLPGTYKVRVTGCNSKFLEQKVTVVNRYLEPPVHSLRFVGGESFKCNTSNSGKVVLNILLGLPNNTVADTQLYRFPLRYQLSTSNDPENGFSSSPFLSFKYSSKLNYQGNFMEYGLFDTINGLSPATTYYVKVTDQCGLYKTVAITTPSPQNTALGYNFLVKEPYRLNVNADNQFVKNNCIQWGELTILNNGFPVNLLSSGNTFAPITAVLKRLDNNEVIASRNFTKGAFYKSSNRNKNHDNNLIFDSVPRVPVQLQLTDQCGLVTTINITKPSSNVPFRGKATAKCSTKSNYLFVNTINAVPSLPVSFKIYDSTNKLVVNKTLNEISYQHIYLPGMISLCCDQSSIVPSYGKYSIVMQDQCGNKDSIVHNFQAINSSTAAPQLSFIPYRAVEQSYVGQPDYYVDVMQKIGLAVGKIEVVSGPSGLLYPRSSKTTTISNSSSGGSGISKIYFDSLLAGTYQVNVEYGCGQVFNTSFTIASALPVSLTGTIKFNIESNVCNAAGSSVKGVASITSIDPNFIVADLPCIRITQAPQLFLQEAAAYKNGLSLTLPLNLGNFNAISTNSNGIDTNSVLSYPLYSFQQFANGFYRFPAGNYTFQLYGKASNKVLDTKSFTISDAGYSSPNLGASAGYICDGGAATIVISPVGGRRSFLHQIKLASNPDPNGWSPLQRDSVFVLPSGIPAGTIYNIRTIDACNNSFTGQVVVNSFTGTFYIAFSNDCIGSPARIVTGFIPGAIYTWQKPDGSTVVTNSNELYLAKFTISDIGTYSVKVNALDGCITRSASSAAAGTNCYKVPTLAIQSFDALKINQQTVDVVWAATNEDARHHYEIERSINGTDWNYIATQSINTFKKNVPAAKYSFKDNLPSSIKSAVIYYRIKQVDDNKKVSYTQLKKVYFNNEFDVLNVYPVPFVNSLQIDFMAVTNDKAFVSLFDMSGKEMSRSVMPVIKGINNFQYTPNTTINAGSYILIISQGVNKFVTKVVKID